ncbi:MAG: methyltransferase [Rhodospirillales bacterium]|nr:methyltransferase [Rhodospirillales bacterium]
MDFKTTGQELSEEISEDALLGGRVRLRQPKQGYRAAIDPVFLAAAVPAKAGEIVLDAGSGAGAAALSLAVRMEGVRVTGIELNAATAGLARENADLNGLAGRLEFIHGDILSPPRSLRPGSFDHVMVNPPHMTESSGHPPTDAARARAHVEGDAVLSHWLGFCLKMVRAKGSITVIHRTDRLDEVLAGLGRGAGDIAVFPLWPKGGVASKRVIVRARKGVKTPMRLLSGLVLHLPDGSYTPQAAAVLAGGGMEF